MAYKGGEEGVHQLEDLGFILLINCFWHLNAAVTSVISHDHPVRYAHIINHLGAEGC